MVECNDDLHHIKLLKQGQDSINQQMVNLGHAKTTGKEEPKKSKQRYIYKI